MIIDQYNKKQYIVINDKEMQKKCTKVIKNC